MNVSELSDVELNRAMIWLYPPEHRRYDPIEDDGELCWSGSYEDAIYYEYLSDYNLTMPLAVEHSLCIEMYSTRDYPTDTHVCSSMCGHASTNKNPLRAIAEVLIKIAMEKKG